MISETTRIGSQGQHAAGLLLDAYGRIRDLFAVEAKYTRFLETWFPCFRTPTGGSVICSQLRRNIPDFWKHDFPVSGHLRGNLWLVRSYDAICQILEIRFPCFRTTTVQSKMSLQLWQYLSDFLKYNLPVSGRLRGDPWLSYDYGDNARFWNMIFLCPIACGTICAGCMVKKMPHFGDQISLFPNVFGATRD